MVAFFLICAGASHGEAACVRGGMLAGGGAGRLDGGRAWAQYSVSVFSMGVSRHTLWAFYNIVLFSSRNLTNQIAGKSRLNWDTL